MRIGRLISHFKSKVSSQVFDFSKYRHKPNIAPFTIDLSPKTFKDSDAFIKECKKDTNYAIRVNYRYKKG